MAESHKSILEYKTLYAHDSKSIRVYTDLIDKSYNEEFLKFAGLSNKIHLDADADEIAIFVKFLYNPICYVGTFENIIALVKLSKMTGINSLYDRTINGDYIWSRHVNACQLITWAYRAKYNEFYTKLLEKLISILDDKRKVETIKQADILLLDQKIRDDIFARLLKWMN